MIVAHTRQDLAAALAGMPRIPGTTAAQETPAATPLTDTTQAREATGKLVLVPTMGALHDGHRALLRRARELAGPAGLVVVSIFVNPLQFGPTEDLDRYPRTLDDDLAACTAEGVNVVFAPAVSEMYPEPQLVTVDPGLAGQILEGEFRPGFFRGVLTVVLKLFTLVRPDIAVFGQKDAQQLALVRKMAADFALGIEVEGMPTVRGADGLAQSSRNKYLSPAERAIAPVLYQALSAGAAAAADGPAAVVAAAAAVLDGAAAVNPLGTSPTVDYLALVDARSFAIIARVDDKPADKPPAEPEAAEPEPDPTEPEDADPKLEATQPDATGPQGATGAGVRSHAPVLADLEFDSVPDRTAVLAIAARVGTTRLIDNVTVRLSPGNTALAAPGKGQERNAADN